MNRDSKPSRRTLAALARWQAPTRPADDNQPSKQVAEISATSVSTAPRPLRTTDMPDAPTWPGSMTRTAKSGRGR